MKYTQILLLAFVLMGVGCGKKYTCSYNYFYQPSAIAFTGYTSGSLPYFVVERYTAQTQFAELLGADTFITANALAEGDTLTMSAVSNRHNGFLKIEEGVDYKVITSLPLKEFTITGVRKGKLSETWTQKQRCSSGSGVARIVPLLFDVTSGISGIYRNEPNNYFIFLSL